MHIQMPKMFKSKRAAEGEASFPSSFVNYLIIAIIFTYVVVGGQAVAVQHLKLTSNAVSPRVERFVTEYRFMNSPDCFAYYDADSKRAYPGIIDAEKFTENVMAACYDIGKESKKNCFKFELADFEGNKLGTLYSNNWEGNKCFQKPLTRDVKYVLIKKKEGNLLEKGMLYVDGEN